MKRTKLKQLYSILRVCKLVLQREKTYIPVSSIHVLSYTSTCTESLPCNQWGAERVQKCVRQCPATTKNCNPPRWRVYMERGASLHVHGLQHLLL